uniref:Uncharacterized protein n=1 Tax=Anguilla anguilla TaxID=7936 RepID=A0A0E9WYN4_ANGAN
MLIHSSRHMIDGSHFLQSVSEETPEHKAICGVSGPSVAHRLPLGSGYPFSHFKCECQSMTFD